MKTTFDLSDGLLHQAKAIAARQGRSLRDLVSEALQQAVTDDERAGRADPNGGTEWDAFLSRLERKPDGTYFNPEGIQDEQFFEVLDSLRAERLSQPMRDPFEGLALEEPGTEPSPASTLNRKKPPRR